MKRRDEIDKTLPPEHRKETRSMKNLRSISFDLLACALLLCSASIAEACADCRLVSGGCDGIDGIGLVLQGRRRIATKAGNDGMRLY